VSIKRPKTKKPTCVGFFVKQNLLNILISLRVLQQEQVRQPEQMQPRRQEQMQLRRQELERVQRLEPVRELELELQICHKRLRIELTGQQAGRSISYYFSFSLKSIEQKQPINSVRRRQSQSEATAFYQYLEESTVKKCTKCIL